MVALLHLKVECHHYHAKGYIAFCCLQSDLVIDCKDDSLLKVDQTFLPIKDRCPITFKIRLYSEDIYCEVLPMNVGHILLGLPWLYDNDVKR